MQAKRAYWRSLSCEIRKLQHLEAKSWQKSRILEPSCLFWNFAKTESGFTCLPALCFALSQLRTLYLPTLGCVFFGAIWRIMFRESSQDIKHENIQERFEADLHSRVVADFAPSLITLGAMRKLVGATGEAVLYACLPCTLAYDYPVMMIPFKFLLAFGWEFGTTVSPEVKRLLYNSPTARLVISNPKW